MHPFKAAQGKTAALGRSASSAFERLTTNSDDVLVVSCSDHGGGAGVLSASRTVHLCNPGNHVADTGARAAIEHALVLRGVRDVVVWGHTRCRALATLLADDVVDRRPTRRWKAARTRAQPLDNPGEQALIKALKRNTRSIPTWRLHYQELPISEGLLEIAVAENVLDQVAALAGFCAEHPRIDRDGLSFHAWVHDEAPQTLLGYDASEEAFVSLRSLPA